MRLTVEPFRADQLIKIVNYRPPIFPESFFFARLIHVGNFYFIPLGTFSFKDY
jgi:hypothetical protein